MEWKRKQRIPKFEAPVQTLYDPEKQHEVHTDESSGKKKSAVLYYSRHCSDDGIKNHSHEFEVLAIVESLERFRLICWTNLWIDCAAVTNTPLSNPL